MLLDVLIALLITAVAVALGVTVHPLLCFVIVLAVVYLISRHRARGRRGAGVGGYSRSRR